MIDVQASQQILGAMITPAVLISASGTLLLSTSNRLGRVVDRIRVLVDEVEKFTDVLPENLPAPSEEKKLLVYEQLSQLSKRIYLLQSALTILYGAIGLLVATSIAIGLSSFLPPTFGSIPVILALAGGSLLLFGSVVLVREARLAVGTTIHELDYVRNLVARKTAKKIDLPEITETASDKR
ncbi:DUF2721 domain-containing protein [Telmatocola sphagniphila]|uniref:DUF2721 domain-containing protein n=1 Tax=Telmatocola sphagniphila TaxID=1123043 RepID=A0A8E6B3L8_9BACT|nr:DUF2721 domain-containing protein [Telmatocola sphagniphila]QVL31575.1 DUF2721 domain-containing protein [Telmatocola sphagniphila]